MSDASNKVPKLNGRPNYPQWRMIAKSTLMGNELWVYVDPAGTLKKRPKKEDGKSDTEIKTWEKANSKAMAWLMVNCVTDIQLVLSRMDTASEMWAWLEQYQEDGLAYRYQLWSEFMDCVYDGKDIQSFTLEYQRILRELAAVGIAPHDEIKVYTLINRVSKHYPQWAGIQRNSLHKIKASDKDTKLPELTTLVSELLQEARSEQIAETANLTKQSNNNRQHRGNGRRSDKKCDHCKGSGHVKDDCWKLYPDKAPEGWRKRNENNSKNDARNEDIRPHKGFQIKQQSRRQHRVFRVTYAVYLGAQRYGSKDDWILDTGASVHCVNDLSHFTKHRPCHETVEVGDGESLQAQAKGTVERVLRAPDGSLHSIEVNDCLYVPSMVVNLLSAEMFRNKGLFYRNDNQTLFTKNEVIGSLKTVHGLPHLVQPALKRALTNSRVIHPSAATADLWHQRYGHLSADALKHAVQQHLGIKVIGELKHSPCQACDLALNKRVISRVPHQKPETPYSEVNVDILVPSTHGLRGERYATTITDSTTLYRHTECHGSKTGSGAFIRNHIVYVETQLGIKVKAIRMDNERAYGGKPFENWLKERGIRILKTTPYNSIQNGTAEATNHLIVVHARKMMIAGHIPKFLWPEALQASVYLLNLMPSPTLKGKSPYTRLAEHMTSIGDNDWPTQPSIAHLKAYGCVAYIHNEVVARGDKFEARALKGRLVGYESHTIYRIWVPSERRIVRSTSVKFDETSFDIGGSIEDDDEGSELDFADAREIDEPVDIDMSAADDEAENGPNSSDSLPLSSPPASPALPGAYPPPADAAAGAELDDGLPEVGGIGGGHGSPPVLRRLDGTERRNAERQLGLNPRRSRDRTPSPDNDNAIDEELIEPPALRRPRDKGNKTEKARDYAKQAREGLHGAAARNRQQAIDARMQAAFDEEHRSSSSGPRMARATHVAYMAGIRHQEEGNIVIPNSIEEAQAQPEWPMWLEACRRELKSHESHATWRLVNAPIGASIVKGKWVFTLKRDASGAVVRYKARWVARGFTQQQGVDFDETYAQVSKPSTVRTALTITALRNLLCKQYDIVTAFLNSKIDHVIYVEQPHGFAEGDMVCLLIRALYGLKQSPLLWYQELSTFLQSVGFTSCWADSCLFRHSCGALILIYVDDLLVIAAQSKDIELVEQQLSKRFTLQNLGNVHYYLGCRIIRDHTNRLIYMVQDGYMKKLRQRFEKQLIHQRRVETSIDPGFKWVKACDSDIVSNHQMKLYQRMVGGVMWPSQMTRPDNLYAVHKLSTQLSGPTDTQFDQAVRNIEYLTGHSSCNLGLKLGSVSDDSLEVYVDASYGDDEDNRRSTCGYLIKYHGSPIAFKSGRQSIVALSTTEAEYIAMTLAAREALAIRNLLMELKEMEPDQPIILHEDNQPSIDSLAKSTSSGHNKHIDIRWHFIRQEVDNGHIKINKVSTDHQAADGLTKALSKVKFKRFINQIGMVDCTALIDAQDKKEVDQ